MSTNRREQSRHKDVMAGFSSGVVSTLLNHPLDLIKTRVQLGRSLTSVVRQLVATKSSASIFRGLGVNVLGNSVAWACYFSLYEELKHWTNNGYFVSSVVSGMTTMVLTNPLWIIKTRMLSTSKKMGYPTLKDGLKDLLIINQKQMVRGLLPGLVGVFQASLQFTIYDSLKHYQKQKSSVQDLQFSQYFYMISFSKIVSSSLFYPFQLLKTRLQSYDYNHFKLGELILSTYKNEGIKGYYKGISINILRTLPSTCVTFLTYEFVKKWL